MSTGVWISPWLERLDILFAQPFDVEGVPGRKVFEPLDDLRRADQAAGANQIDLPVLSGYQLPHTGHCSGNR